MIAAALALTLAASPEVWAVSVGHNGAAPGLPALHYADDDALRFARWVAALPGAAPERTLVLTRVDDETRAELDAAKLAVPATVPPTRKALAAALEQVRTRIESRQDRGADVTVYFFYAGHGLSERLVLEPEVAPDAAITGRELKGQLAELGKARVVVLLDACRSASLFTERGVDLTAEIQALETKASQASLGVLTAARSDRPAGESASLHGGVFSHVLVSGLAGAADADADGLVTYGELAAFVAVHTERLTGQRPWFEPPHGRLIEVAADLRGGTSLVLDASVGGRVRVGAAPGAPLWAEVHAASGRAVRLLVVPGTYRVERLLGGERTEATLAVAASSTLKSADFAPSTRTERGGWEQETFGVPFTTEAVAALDVGWQSGRTVAPEQPWRHSLELAYVGAPSSLGPAYEHGAQLGWRWRFWGPWFAGPRLAVHVSQHQGEGPALVRRLGALVVGGAVLQPASWLDVSAWGGVGLNGLWLERPGRLAGDLAAPALAAGLRAEVPLTRDISVWLAVEGQLAWLAVDGQRRPFAAPLASLGLAVRR